MRQSDKRMLKENEEIERLASVYGAQKIGTIFVRLTLPNIN